MRKPIQFCTQCGGHVELKLPPDGDNKERAICAHCGHIHYENPLIVVGVVGSWQEKILLCKRNIEPGKGLWTLPAGFMEIGESLAQAAQREAKEEAGASLRLEELFSVFNTGHFGFVHFFYRAQLLSDDFELGHETQAAELFEEWAIPWDQIAFSSVRATLQAYFADRRQGEFQLHELNLP